MLESIRSHPWFILFILFCLQSSAHVFFHQSSFQSSIIPFAYGNQFLYETGVYLHRTESFLSLHTVQSTRSKSQSLVELLTSSCPYLDMMVWFKFLADLVFNKLPRANDFYLRSPAPNWVSVYQCEMVAEFFFSFGRLMCIWRQIDSSQLKPKKTPDRPDITVSILDFGCEGLAGI